MGLRAVNADFNKLGTIPKNDDKILFLKDIGTVAHSIWAEVAVNPGAYAIVGMAQVEKK